MQTVELEPSVQSHAAGFTFASRPEAGLQLGRPSVIRSRKLCRWMVEPNPACCATKAMLSPVGVPPPTPPASGEAVAPTRLMAKSTALALSRSAESSSELGSPTSMALAGVQKLLGLLLPGSVMVASDSAG